MNAATLLGIVVLPTVSAQIVRVNGRSIPVERWRCFLLGSDGVVANTDVSCNTSAWRDPASRNAVRCVITTDTTVTLTVAALKPGGGRYQPNSLPRFSDRCCDNFTVNYPDADTVVQSGPSGTSNDASVEELILPAGAAMKWYSNSQSGYSVSDIRYPAVRYFVSTWQLCVDLVSPPQLPPAPPLSPAPPKPPPQPPRPPQTPPTPPPSPPLLPPTAHEEPEWFGIVFGVGRYGNVPLVPMLLLGLLFAAIYWFVTRCRRCLARCRRCLPRRSAAASPLVSEHHASQHASHEQGVGASCEAVELTSTPSIEKSSATPAVLGQI